MSYVKLEVQSACLQPRVFWMFVLAKIGRSAARELFLTGERFAAARARELGLVHAVVPAIELTQHVTHPLAYLFATIRAWVDIGSIRNRCRVWVVV